MDKLVIKKWIDGNFKEVAQHNLEDIAQIRHHKEGLELIVQTGTYTGFKLYDPQCVIEFQYFNPKDKDGKK